MYANVLNKILYLRSIILKQIFEIHIRTVSEANSTEHWTVKAKRHRRQQMFVNLAYHKHISKVELPCRVNLISCSSKKMDDDNLRSSLKYVRDELSELILQVPQKFYFSKTGKKVRLKGQHDCDERIEWHYFQEISNRKKIRIEIEDI